LPDPSELASLAIPFVDPSGDGFATPLDVLTVVNHINARPTGEGEGPVDGITEALHPITTPTSRSPAATLLPDPAHWQQPVVHCGVLMSVSGGRGSCRAFVATPAQRELRPPNEARHSNTDKVTSPQHVAPNDVPTVAHDRPADHAADVFVFPSPTETFGQVMLQANACGAPVAAFPVIGPRDVIVNGINGFVDNDLSRAAQQCLPLKTEDCVKHARRFSWDACTDTLLSLLAPIATHTW